MYMLSIPITTLSGVVAVLLFAQPDKLAYDPLNFASFFAMTTFVAWFFVIFYSLKNKEIKWKATSDREALDFWQKHPEYAGGLAPSGNWSFFHAETGKTCYGKTLRQCLGTLQIMHIQTTGWERRKEMYDLKVGKAGLKKAVKAEEGSDIQAGYRERDA